MRSYRSAILVVLLAVLVTSCGDDPPATPEEDGPHAAALRIFRFAETDLDAPDTGARVREVIDVGDRDLAALLDALEGLRGVDQVRVVGAEALEDTGRWIVDLEGELPGPSLAEYGVEVVETPNGWRAAWFHGPGVEWPGRPTGRDPSLTTSHPPETSD